jgi:hypothetical protein
MSVYAARRLREMNGVKRCACTLRELRGVRVSRVLGLRAPDRCHASEDDELAPLIDSMSLPLEVVTSPRVASKRCYVVGSSPPEVIALGSSASCSRTSPGALAPTPRVSVAMTTGAPRTQGAERGTHRRCDAWRRARASERGQQQLRGLRHARCSRWRAAVGTAPNEC